jgi:5-methylcytosine-specific restriction endonuclease McrA
VKNRAYDSTVYRRNRKIVIAAADGICSIPGCGRPAHCDHIIPLRKGGDHSLSNLQALCKSHNSQAGVKITNEIKAAKKLGRRSRQW